MNINDDGTITYTGFESPPIDIIKRMGLLPDDVDKNEKSLDDSKEEDSLNDDSKEEDSEKESEKETSEKEEDEYSDFYWGNYYRGKRRKQNQNQ